MQRCIRPLDGSSTETAVRPERNGEPGSKHVQGRRPGSQFQLRIRARRNLGGGLSAWAQIEQNAPLERANTAAVSVGSRNSAAGVQGSFGNVFAGQWTTPWATWSPYGASVRSYLGAVTPDHRPARDDRGTPSNLGSACGNFASGGITTPATLCDAVAGQGGVGHPFWRRASSMIRYTSPTLNGVIFDALYQVPETKRVVNAAGLPSPSTPLDVVDVDPVGGHGVGRALALHSTVTRNSPALAIPTRAGRSKAAGTSVSSTWARRSSP